LATIDGAARSALEQLLRGLLAGELRTKDYDDSVSIEISA
jgi:hypothetical protein